MFAGVIGGCRQLDQYADQVFQSFARMLEHEPYYCPTAAVAQAGGDPLAERVYSALRRESLGAGIDSAPGADYWINVAESFRRTFSHQPYAGETSGVERAAADPLEVTFYAMFPGGLAYPGLLRLAPPLGSNYKVALAGPSALRPSSARKSSWPASILVL